MRRHARLNGGNSENNKEWFVQNVGVLNIIGNQTRKTLSVNVVNTDRVCEVIQLCTAASYLFGIGLLQFTC